MKSASFNYKCYEENLPKRKLFFVQPMFFIFVTWFQNNIKINDNEMRLVVKLLLQVMQYNLDNVNQETFYSIQWHLIRITFYLPFWFFLYRRLQMHHDQSGLLIYTRIFRQIPSWRIYYDLEEWKITTVAIYSCQKIGLHQLNTIEIRLYA